MTTTPKSKAAKPVSNTAHPSKAGAPVIGGPMTGAPMTGGMAIVEQLIANGIDQVFGIPGAQTYPLFDALKLKSDHIRTFGARHEQTCAYMAFGAARARGRPAVFTVVPGPGVLNTTAALCTAMGTNTPVLCLTGQVPSAYMGRGRGHLHELVDQLATLRPLVKWAARIERAADAPGLVNEAFHQMQSGRPGPVVLEMCWDVMAATGHVMTLPASIVPATPPPSPTDVDAAAKLLATAKRPMIFVGSGALEASTEVLALAELLDAPVTSHRGGRGIVAEDHPLGISGWTAHKFWPDMDVAIAIGTRLEMPYMRWPWLAPLIDRPVAPPHIIRIDIDPVEMRRFVPHAAIVADAAAGTRALREAVERLRPKATPQQSRSARAPIAATKTAARREIEIVQPQVGYLDVIRACLPRDGIINTELTQVGFTSYFAYPVFAPRTYISEGFQGTLGYGFPTMLGVKAAKPDTPAVCITGDGGFQFALQELATAKQENIALVTLVFNNAAYGNVLRDQRDRFGNRIIGAVLDNPDFVALAKAYGIAGHRVATPDALRPVLAAALKANAPVLIEVQIPQGSEISPWPFIHPQPQ